MSVVNFSLLISAIAFTLFFVVMDCWCFSPVLLFRFFRCEFFFSADRSFTSFMNHSFLFFSQYISFQLPGLLYVPKYSPTFGDNSDDSKTRFKTADERSETTLGKATESEKHQGTPY